MRKDFFLEKSLAIIKEQNTCKLIIELAGEEGNEYQRAQRAKSILEQSLLCLFEKDPIRMAMISWGTNIGFRKQILDCRISAKIMPNWIKGSFEDEVFDAQRFKPDLIYYSHHIEISDALKIGNGIINNELGVDPYIHANVYFMAFNDRPFLINLFDDRYFELICKAEFEDYLKEKLIQESILFS